MAGHILGILAALAALYFAGAFVSAKLFKRDQWPFKAAALELPAGGKGAGKGGDGQDQSHSA